MSNSQSLTALGFQLYGSNRARTSRLTQTAERGALLLSTDAAFPSNANCVARNGVDIDLSMSHNRG